jgi:hypothetical protein
MEINLNNLDLHELQQLKRTMDIIKNRGATLYLSEEQIQSILNRIKELQEKK